MLGDEARAAATAKRIVKDMGKDFTLESECEWLLGQKRTPKEGFNALVTRLGLDNTNARLYRLIEMNQPEILSKLVMQRGFTNSELLAAMKECSNIGEVAQKLNAPHHYIRDIVKRDYPNYAKKLVRQYSRAITGELRRLLATDDMVERRRLADENGITMQQAHNIAHDWRKKNAK